MPDINISVKNKIAVQTNKTEYICDNSDFIIKFNFDAEWDAYDTKTARICYNSKYVDAVFTGDSCAIPIISDTNDISIGVYAGNLHTTTPALVLCEKSILGSSGFPADPPDDVYNQIMELIQGLGTPNAEAIAKAVADYLAAHPIEETDPTVPEWAKAEITGATVGQIAQITAVDASGVPTAWSPVDMPSGGEGETWEKLYDGTIQIEQETMAIEVDMPRNDSAKEFQIYLHFTKNTAQAWDAAKVITVKVNGASFGHYTFVDKLVSDFYAFANREFDSIGKLEHTSYPASLYANRAPMFIQLQTGKTAEQKNDGKISISFVSPYAGAIELLVYGRY